MITADKHFRISAKALIWNPTRDKFLVVQEEGSGLWDFPGGGLEHGEGPEECLRREIDEEMGVPVTFVAKNPSYFLTGQFQSPQRKGQWYANVFYEVTLESLNFRPSDECVACRFVSPKEARELRAYNSVKKLADLLEA